MRSSRSSRTLLTEILERAMIGSLFFHVTRDLRNPSYGTFYSAASAVAEESELSPLPLTPFPSPSGAP